MGSGRTERSSSRRRPLLTKRACVRLTLLLIAGAIVNVAVAWGCMVGINVQNGGLDRWSLVSIPPTHYWSITAHDKQGRSERMSSVWTGTIHSNWPETRAAELIPLWGRAGRPPIPQLESSMPTDMNSPLLSMEFVDQASGWPFLALWQGWGDTNIVVGGNLFARYGQAPPLLHPDRLSVVIDTARKKALPLRPIWPGFAINTVFYAFILWLLFALGGTPFALRRRLRVKRGLCVKCAYDLRGRFPASDVCPECGSGATGTARGTGGTPTP